MKKLLFLVCVLMSAMLTFAQETKKVAILEVVDKENKISYANKLILRSNLAKAITNTPGYEAYDRTDMDAILGEQNFQRTGMVSNDQIKRLGEMTGAKFVLVAEAAVVDANTMYITAKLLDVETARTEMTDNQMMGVTAKEIQRGCQLLASNLIKPVVISHSSQPATKPEKSTKREKSSEKAQNNSSTPSGGLITKVSRNEYRLNGSKMDRKAYERFIYENCPEAWKKYKSGKAAIATGWTFFALGAAATIAGGVYYAKVDHYYDMYEYYSDQALQSEIDSEAQRIFTEKEIYYWDLYRDHRDWGIALMSGGGGLAVVGLVTFSSGYGVKNNAYKTYNKKCANNPVSLNLTTGKNGLGLAINF